jgi:hypothetical protein
LHNGDFKRFVGLIDVDDLEGKRGRGRWTRPVKNERNGFLNTFTKKTVYLGPKESWEADQKKEGGEDADGRKKRVSGRERRAEESKMGGKVEKAWSRQNGARFDLGA